MSDLGAIFHVKKAGVQYDAHAYTTLDECPEPSLKINFKGQQAYVKMEAKGSGDVPCYVKTKAGNVYQVKKEAVPTGELVIRGNITFTVPSSVKVIEARSPYKDNWESKEYVGVTPNSVHKLTWRVIVGNNSTFYRLRCASHKNKDWVRNEDYEENAILLWSPEINKKTPTVTDY